MVQKIQSEQNEDCLMIWKYWMCEECIVTIMFRISLWNQTKNVAKKKMWREPNKLQIMKDNRTEMGDLLRNETRTYI